MPTTQLLSRTKIANHDYTELLLAMKPPFPLKSKPSRRSQNTFGTDAAKKFVLSPCGGILGRKTALRKKIMLRTLALKGYLFFFLPEKFLSVPCFLRFLGYGKPSVGNNVLSRRTHIQSHIHRSIAIGRVFRK